MKKIKLLTPILSATAIASNFVAMTSCSRNPEDELGITKQQWQSAFYTIQNPRCDRNFTINLSGKSCFVESAINAWKVQATNGATIGYDFTSGEIAGKYPSWSAVVYDDVIWTYTGTLPEGSKPDAVPLFIDGYTYQESQNPTMKALDLAAGIFAELYNGIERIGNMKFRYSAVNGESYSLFCDFEFDSSYRISKINPRLNSKISNNSYETLLEIDCAFTYGSTQLKFDKDSFDYSKTLFTATQQDDKFTVTAAEDKTNLKKAFAFNLPQDSTIKNLRTITITQDRNISNVNLILNGNILYKYIDYYISDDSKTIILNNSLKNGDKLRVLVDQSISQNIQLDLTKYQE